MIIDHHVHLGTDVNETGYSLTPEELISKMDRFGIDKSVVFSCPNLTPTEKNPYRLANNMIKHTYEELGTRLIPFMFVHPFLDELRYLEKEQSEFKGFKVYSHATGMEYSYATLPKSPQFRFIASLRKPMLFHTSKSAGGRIQDALTFMKLASGPIAFAHCGRLFHDELLRASAFPNVFVDVSPLATTLDQPRKCFAGSENLNVGLCMRPDAIIGYLSRLFGKRILWGSDTPWCDKLLGDGYVKEVGILDEFHKQGISNDDFVND